jgi:HSP20 family protein
MRELRKSWTLFVPDVQRPWRPLADVFRTREGWLLRFDLAGVRLQDVVVSIEGRHVTVSGIRRNTSVEEGSSYYLMEISYNQFERTIEMPVCLEQSRVVLEAQDGILLVRIHTEGNGNVR